MWRQSHGLCMHHPAHVRPQHQGARRRDRPEVFTTSQEAVWQQEINVNWMVNKLNLDLSLEARLEVFTTFEEQITSQARPSPMH